MNVQVKAGEPSGQELNYWVNHVIGFFTASWRDMDTLSRSTKHMPYGQRREAVGYLMQKINIGLALPPPPAFADRR